MVEKTQPARGGEEAGQPSHPFFLPSQLPRIMIPSRGFFSPGYFFLAIRFVGVVRQVARGARSLKHEIKYAHPSGVRLDGG